MWDWQRPIYFYFLLFCYLLTVSIFFIFFIHEQHLKEMVNILKQYLSNFTIKKKKEKRNLHVKKKSYGICPLIRLKKEAAMTSS